MNHDNPKLTAYALNELPEQDRADIERLIAEDAHAAAEMRETADTAQMMRTLFQAELTETLDSRRRLKVLQAAAQPPALRTAPADRKIITPSVAWWQRASTWQLAAACVVFGFGVYAITDALGSKAKTPERTASQGVEINIRDLAKHDGNSAPAPAPGMVTPSETGRNSPSLIAKVAPSPGINVVPNPKPSDVGNALKVEPGTPPRVVSATPARDGMDPSIAARASVGRKDRVIASQGKTTNGGIMMAAPNPGIKTTLPGDMEDVILSVDEAARYHSTQEYLAARWQEAASIREGASTYGDLARSFRRDGGSTAGDAQRFVMIRCPFIKVDVEFEHNTADPLPMQLPPEMRIRKISKPYFEPER